MLNLPAPLRLYSACRETLANAERDFLASDLPSTYKWLDSVYLQPEAQEEIPFQIPGSRFEADQLALVALYHGSAGYEIHFDLFKDEQPYCHEDDRKLFHPSISSTDAECFHEVIVPRDGPPAMVHAEHFCADYEVTDIAQLVKSGLAEVIKDEAAQILIDNLPVFTFENLYLCTLDKK